jgi:leader peptidase (prepilin peptidase)/N-methyltransferase
MTIVTGLAVALFGWLAGGLVNYLADFLPRRRRLGPPFCLRCEGALPWTWAFLPVQRCPACGQSGSLRRWLVLVGVAGAAVWLWALPPERLGFIAGFLLLAYLVLVAVIDIEHRLILHKVSAVGALFALAIGAWLHGILPTLIGGLVGLAGMFLLYLFGALFVRFRSGGGALLADGEALGFGDVIFSGVLGLLLGWPGILAGLLLAVLLGGIAGLLALAAALFARRYRPDLAIPYGPFLVLSAIVLMYFL